jgi:YD repeat-containing protein
LSAVARIQHDVGANALRRGRQACAILLLVFCGALGYSIAVQAEIYSYDALDRLVRVEYVDGTVVTYVYDAAGNRTTKTVVKTTPSGSLTILLTGSGAVASNPSGISCGPDCSETYASGTVVTLTAEPKSNAPGGIYTFVGWGGECSGFGTQPACTLTMNAAKSATATFGYVGNGSAYSRDYVQKAYVAYYGRPADPGGQGYWAARMDAEGKSLDAIIGAFGNSDEFNRRYGGLSFSDLVTKIYQQTLGRNPDAAGLAYYVGELQAGRRTLQSITLDVLNGATTPPDSTVVANKLDVAAYVTAKVAAGCLYGTEQGGVDSLAGVTAVAATVTAAKAAVDARCGP